MSWCVDQDLVIRQLTARIERTASPRQRAMLERVREHAAAEARGDLQGLMGTLGAEPAYHFWEFEGDTGPKGRDGVRDFYAGYVADRRQFLEVDCERIVVDDDCVVMESVLKAVFPGEVIARMPLSALVEQVDPGRSYLLTGRNVLFWPIDENLDIVGEDSYSGGPFSLRLLDEDELPDGYRALLADQRPTP